MRKCDWGYIWRSLLYYLVYSVRVLSDVTVLSQI